MTLDTIAGRAYERATKAMEAANRAAADVDAAASTGDPAVFRPAADAAKRASIEAEDAAHEAFKTVSLAQGLPDDERVVWERNRGMPFGDDAIVSACRKRAQEAREAAQRALMAAGGWSSADQGRFPGTPYRP
jgi:hypothetical protein